MVSGRGGMRDKGALWAQVAQQEMEEDAGLGVPGLQ